MKKTCFCTKNSLESLNIQTFEILKSLNIETFETHFFHGSRNWDFWGDPAVRPPGWWLFTILVTHTHPLHPPHFPNCIVELHIVAHWFLLKAYKFLDISINFGHDIGLWNNFLLNAPKLNDSTTLTGLEQSYLLNKGS